MTEIEPTRWVPTNKADSADFLDDEKEPKYATPLYTDEERAAGPGPGETRSRPAELDEDAGA